MNYPHLSEFLVKEIGQILMDSDDPINPYWEALVQAGYNPERVPKAMQLRRDMTLRTKAPKKQQLWDDDGNPTDAHWDLIELGYSPSPRKLADWVDWYRHGDEDTLEEGEAHV